MVCDSGRCGPRERGLGECGLKVRGLGGGEGGIVWFGSA